MKLIFSYIIVCLAFSGLRGQFSDADLQRINSLKKEINETHQDSIESKLEAYLTIAHIHKEHDRDLAFSYLDSATLFLHQSARTDLLPRIISLRGSFYVKQGNLMKALQEYEQGIQYQEAKDKKTNFHIGYLYIDVGNIFYKLRRYKDAINFYKKAQDIFSKTSDFNSKKGRAVANNNIGLCHLRVGESDLALNRFEQALKLRRTLGSQELITHSYTHILDLFLVSEQLTRADSLVKYALSDTKLDTTSVWYTELNFQVIRLLILQSKLDEAGQRIKDFDITSFGDNAIYFTPYVLQTKAEYQIAKNNLNQAKHYIDSGYTVALNTKNYSAALRFSEMGKDISVQQNNIAQALKYTDNIIELKDSTAILSEGLVAELLEMNVAFTKAQQQNIALKSTSADYYARIKGQNWLLFGALLIIIILLILFWYINKLSRKQKQNQQNQRELNQRILAVVNNTDSHILSLNADGVIRLINQSAIEFFKNWIENDVRAGDNLFEKINNIKVRRLWSSWFEKSKTQSGWKEVSQIKIKDKTYYYLENFSTIQKTDGQFAGLVLVGNDITKEHEFSVEIAQQRDDLEKSNLAKENMLSILAHDLKDAVYSARSLSEMVKETPDQFSKEELLHLFGLLFNNFDRTKNLLDGLLEWMKTQTGAMEAQLLSFSLKELSEEVKNDCEERSQKKGIEVNININEGVSVIADKEMIRTVMRNLISNAIKYTEPNDGKIEISAMIHGGKTEIHVVDNGKGISPADQKRLFQSGGRFTTPGTNNELGTGFGLSLCQELLRLNDSALLLESVESRGSDFHFSLPLVNKSEEALKLKP